MPTHITLPKSATDSNASGLEMLAWPNGMRYVYCASDPGNTANITGHIPPEYMGSGSVYINDKVQTVSTVGSINQFYLQFTISGNSVVGDSTDGATVTFERGVVLGSGTPASFRQPNKTSILFFVNQA